MLSASLICSDFLHLETDVRLLEEGNIDYIHFDVMDGSFVPRFGLFPEILTQIRRISKIPVDVHMMVENAEKYLPVLVNAGLNRKGDIYIVHIESTRNIDNILRIVKQQGIKAGVALNPGTTLSELNYLLPHLDLIMIMGINPGIVGHKLIPQTIERISGLKNKLGNYPDILIEVDGGVTPESAPLMLKAGADMLVCGSQTIFRPQEASIDQKIIQLRRMLNSL